MSAPLLSQAGEALMGPQWQAPLARALGVNLRTMQRWAAGDGQPPDSVWTDIRKLLALRKSEIARLLRAIR